MKIKRDIILIAILIIAFVFGCGESKKDQKGKLNGNNKKDFIIALIPERNVFEQRKRYKPLCEYLSKVLNLTEIEEKKIEAIKQLIVTIDDKINNKLTGILTSVEVILSNPQKVPDDILGVLGKIKESVHEINNIIAKLSNLRRVITTDYIKGIKMLNIDE